MNKLYPPSINGALPAFYAQFHNLSEFKKNNNSENDFQPSDNSYFITCDNTGAANFTVSPNAQLQLVEDTTDLYCYNGLIIDEANLTGFQQLAIVEKTSDSGNNNKFELKFIINHLHDDWNNLINRRLKIYFTTNRSNYPGKTWIKSQMSNSYIYVEDTVQGYNADIIIPYQNNKSVSLEDITGFALKLKKIQTNTEVCVLRASKDNQTDIEHQINFIIPPENLNKIHPQEFLKAQLAYLYSEDDDDNIGNDEVGYYSTVSIIKYTGKPTIQIQNLSTNDNNSMFLLDKYIGEYNNPLDSTEKPIAHCFSLLIEDTLKETSGWINQNSYSFDTDIIDEKVNYQIKYQVKTLNDLEEEIIYNCVTPSSADPQLKINLHADNNFDNGYVELSFKPDGWIFNSELQNLQKKTITINSTNLQLNIENTNDNNQIFNAVDDDTLKIALGSELQRQDIAVNNNLLTIMSQMIWPDSNKTLYLYRTTSGSDDWTKIATIQNLSSYDNAFEWSFKDFTVEQGKKYQYGFKEQVSKNAIEDVTIIKKSEPIVADFEDAFLWDGQRQIRIRFNPKVSSFKTNRLESKVETIGNRYPFIFRNETVEYKEFPISGLISYLADNAELFMSAAELGIILNQYNERTGTPTSVTNVSYNQSETTDLLSYNIKAERIFKLELLDWLGNGEIKLFKSPTEGNYLVRLMNVSLAPEDRLGRMLHSFSCTAYEVKENTDNNLLKLGFFNNKE